MCGSRRLLAAALAVRLCAAFIWSIDEEVMPDQKLTFTERHMFASHEGPELMEDGAAFIEVHADLTYTSLINASQRAALGMFAVTDGSERRTDDIDMCDERYPPGSEDWLHMANIAHYSGFYKGKRHDPRLNATVFVWGIHLSRKLTVTKQAWHNVAVTLCPSVYSGQVTGGSLEGEVGFRNPYGYIPAEMYGLLPFQGARAVALLALFCVFLFFYLLHRDARLPLHNGIVLVLLVALVEYSVWFGAYLRINETGLPYCCPFPREVVAALMLQVLREVLSRVLLLVVSLGYGIVRPRLLRIEVYAIVFMAVAYLVSSVVAETAKIIFYQKKVNLDVEADARSYSLPQFVLDVLFLSWIYISLTSTIRILSEFRQTAKLMLYNALHRTIIGFCSMFAAVTVLAVLAQSGALTWPWQYSWLLDVLWEALNLAVLVAVAVICMPSGTSRLLTYASQLPTSDDDDLDHMDQFALMMAEDAELEAMDESTHGASAFDDGMEQMSRHGHKRGGEMEMATVGNGHAASQAERHRRIVAAQQRRRDGSAGGGGGDHYSLPDAEDDIDDIFLDDDERI